MRTTTNFREISYNHTGYYTMLGLCIALALIGAFAGQYMGSEGHHVTGMTNRIVWGLPHVVAIFMILAAGGALTAASMAAVLERNAYKPLARLSCVLAFALLAGGLFVLLLDLGQAGRVLPTLTSLNFTSIFSWNIFVYTGFFILVVAQLWMLIEYRMNKYAKPVGVVAFLWRILLATDIGSIFGVVIARPAFDSAIMAPLFVMISFAIGLAIFNLLLVYGYAWTRRPMGWAVMERLNKLLGVFVAIVLFFVAVQHFTAAYGIEREGFENFILKDGSIYTFLFWGIQILLGAIVPLVLILSKNPLKLLFVNKPMTVRTRMLSASILVALGGLTQLYIIIIGGQAYPTALFPGMEVTSSFADGQIASYTPSIYEILLGIGGFGLALLVVVVAVKVLPVLPTSLADADVEPHHKRAAENEEKQTT